MIDLTDRFSNVVVFEKWQALGAEVLHKNHYSTLYSGLSSPYFNKVLLRQKNEITEDEIDQIVLTFSQKGLCHSWIIPKQADRPHIKKWLAKHKLFASEELTGMVLELSSFRVHDTQDHDTQEKVAIQQVFSIDQIMKHVDLFQENYSISSDKIEGYRKRLASYSPSTLRFFIGYLNKEPVASGALLFGTHFAGIFNIGTIPVARRKGVATQMMNTLIHEAQKRGYSQVVLNASQEAVSLYQKIGFTTFGSYRIYLPGE